MTTYLPPVWRVYDKSSKFLRLLGTVEAPSREDALALAVKGTWRNFYGTETDKQLPVENLSINS